MDGLTEGEGVGVPCTQRLVQGSGRQKGSGCLHQAALQRVRLGANVTAIKHSSTSLEFLLDGESVGVAKLHAADAVPDNAVSCAGGCAGIVLGTGKGAPPAPPPPPPPTEIVLALRARQRNVD